MPSTSFRIISGLTIVLLLAALVALIYVTVQTAPTTLPLPTPRVRTTPTATPSPPSAPATPAAQATAEVAAAPATSAPTPASTATAAPTVAVISLLPAPSPTPVAPLPALRRAVADSRFVNDGALADGTLWLATEGGALAWRAGASAPARFTSLDGLRGTRQNAVVTCPLPGLGIVFGSDAGLAIRDPAADSWQYMDAATSGMRFDDVAALACDLENARLLVGYRTHGIDIFDVDANQWRRLDRSSGLGANDVRALAVDNDQDAIWVVAADGVTRAAGQDSAFFAAGVAPLETARVGAVTVSPSGLIWLGGEGALFRIDGENWTRFDAGGGDFPTALITGLAVAADGSVWLVDETATVCRFSAIQNRCVEFYRRDPGMAPGPATGLLLDDESPLYLTAGSGHSLLDGARWRTLAVSEPIRGNAVRSLAVDADGDLWAATGQGVQQFGNGQRPATVYDAATVGIDPATVRVLQPTADGGMWVGGAGAAFYDGAVWATLPITAELVGDVVQAIAVDSQGRTWFGTARGLSIWNGSTLFNITAAQGLPNPDVRALVADGDDIWIGSWGGGLYRFTGGQMEIFTTDNVGLPSDRISALALAADGDLLLGADRGLARFSDGIVTPIPAVTGQVTALAAVDGVTWAAVADAGVYHEAGDKWVQATLADGLPAATITALAATDDALWLGGASGGLVAVAR